MMVTSELINGHHATRMAFLRSQQNNTDGRLPLRVVKITGYETPAEIFSVVRSIPADARRMFLRKGEAYRPAYEPPQDGPGLEPTDEIKATEIYRYYYAAPEWPSGQIVHRPSDNVRLIFEPEWRSPRLWVVTLGCAHEFDTTKSRMCYSEWTCGLCGFQYAVDSSD